MLKTFVPVPLVTCLLAWTSAHAQTVSVISSDPACQKCEIRLEKVLKLGNVFGDPGSQGVPVAIASDSQGHIYAVYSGMRTEVFMHDTTGRVIWNVGRDGAGPGEFRWISEIVVDNDANLHVFDARNARRTIISSKGEIVGMTQIPPRNALDAVILPDGRAIVNSVIPTRRQAGYPLHLVGLDGEIVRSYGADTPVYRPDLSSRLFMVIAPAGDSTFWAAHGIRYSVDLLTPSGNRLLRLRRDAEWFPRRLRNHPVTSENPPEPHVLGIWEDGRDLLWIAVRVNSDKWRTVLEVSSEGAQYVSNAHVGFDTVIEVIDPVTNRLIASRRFDQSFRTFFGDGYLVNHKYDVDNLLVHAFVWRVHLDGWGAP